MTSIDLNNLSLAELKQLQRQLAKAISDFDGRKKSEARSVIEARARELGFALSELLDVSASRKPSVTVQKFRHPENPSVTWSGRGRQPRWFKAAIDAGKSPDSLAV